MSDESKINSMQIKHIREAIADNAIRYWENDFIKQTLTELLDTITDLQAQLKLVYGIFGDYDFTVTDLQTAQKIWDTALKELSAVEERTEERWKSRVRVLMGDKGKLEAELSASREKEQKLIEYYEKRIETEVSKVAQLLRERQAERAAVLESTALMLENAECLPECDSVMHADLCPYVNPGNAIRALITTTDRLALDRYVGEAEHKGWCDALRAVQGSIEGYPNMGGDIGIMTALSRMLDEARLEKVLLLRDAYGEVGHGAFIAFVEGQISKLRAIPAASEGKQ